MDKIILNFPKQFKIGIKSAEEIKIKNKFAGVIICGMGGSALPGDILEIWLRAYKIGLPLFIHRNYGLPYFADENHLIICISYSGNTEETLSAFQKALEQNLSIAVIASGGRLAELAKKNKIPLAIVPSGIVPRLAIGYQFAALLKILSNASIVSNGLENVTALEKNLEPQKIKKQGEKIAKRLINKIPVIYSSCSNKTLAKIWRIAFNETAKITAMSNCFPELSHNEIVGFLEKTKGQIENEKIKVIILRDKADYPRVLKQMKIAKELFEKKGINAEFVNLTEKDILEKIFSNIILAFYTAFFLAANYKVNPIQTKSLDEFKKRLSK